jgi:beta-D-xylosidase 4
VPSCANDWLLKDVARGEWGFEGYITSDCDADDDVFSAHHYLNQTKEEDVRDILRAGTDVDCGGFIGANAQSALTAGTITEADIDERLVNLFKVRIRLAHFDPLNPLDDISSDEICSDYAIETSMDGARQSAALLKNVGNTLPLSSGGSFAVLGPNANLSESDTGYYGPHNCCKKTQYLNLVDVRTPPPPLVPPLTQNCSPPYSKRPFLSLRPWPSTPAPVPWSRTA